jgi:hypothetical protein
MTDPEFVRDHARRWAENHGTPHPAAYSDWFVASFAEEDDAHLPAHPAAWRVFNHEAPPPRDPATSTADGTPVRRF